MASYVFVGMIYFEASLTEGASSMTRRNNFLCSSCTNPISEV